MESDSLGRGESHNAVRCCPNMSFVEAELEVDVGLVDAESGAEAMNVSENGCEVGPSSFRGEGKSSSTSAAEFSSSR